MRSLATTPREPAPEEPTATNGAPSDEFRRAGLTALALLAVLNIADVVITRLLLAHGGFMGNPSRRNTMNE